jgi:hypothetical protein
MADAFKLLLLLVAVSLLWGQVAMLLTLIWRISNLFRFGNGKRVPRGFWFKTKGLSGSNEVLSANQFFNLSFVSNYQVSHYFVTKNELLERVLLFFRLFGGKIKRLRCFSFVFIIA